MTEMTTQIEALTKRLNEEAGIVARAKSGIIDLSPATTGGHNITAYIALDNPNDDAEQCIGLFSGCALVVWSSGGATPQEPIERAQRAKHRLMLQMAEAGIVPGPICERWEEVGVP